jgi:hypothetical protein
MDLDIAVAMAVLSLLLLYCSANTRSHIHGTADRE